MLRASESANRATFFPEAMVELNEAQEKDIDELDYQSDNEDPTVFKVRDALSPPSAMSYSAQELHSASANA